MNARETDNRAACGSWTLKAFFKFEFCGDRGSCRGHHKTSFSLSLALSLSTMTGCGRRGVVFLLIACVVEPSASFLHGSSRPRQSTGTRRPTASSSSPVEHRPKDLDQDETPLVDALAEAASNVRSPLFYPGHKMGRYGRWCCFCEPSVSPRTAHSCSHSAAMGSGHHGQRSYCSNKPNVYRI